MKLQWKKKPASANTRSSNAPYQLFFSLFSLPYVYLLSKDKDELIYIMQKTKQPLQNDVPTNMHLFHNDSYQLDLFKDGI